MKLPLLISWLILPTAICTGQNNDKPMRESFPLNIAIDDSTYYSADIDATAYILSNHTIQLYPGETLYIEVERTNKKIKSMKSVKENLHPDKTLIISFNQQTEGKIHKGMVLKIVNPFKKTLEYKAEMYLAKYDRWVQTNVIPIQPNLRTFETWPDVIVTIALSEWK